MNKKTLSLLIIGMVAACSQAKPCVQYIECPDGRGDCETQARDLCPAGYTRMNEADVGEGFDAFERTHFPGASNGVPHLLVTCTQ